MIYVSLLSKFKGWTIKTIDNLTFSQLDAICTVLNKKKVENKPEVETKVKGFPVAKMTSSETKAWVDAGMPSPASKFVRELRKG